MIIISSLFVAYIIASLWYIHRLHGRLRASEECWKQIEQLTDKNEEGDVIIHCKHI